MAEICAIYDMMDELELTTNEVSLVIFNPSDVELEFDDSVMDSQLIY